MSPFLTATWRRLVMLNFPIERDLLAPHAPDGVELDECDGSAFVSLVAFQFLHARLLGVPIPFHQHFDEVNLRFYVRRFVDGEMRRGVVFIKEIVPKFFVAAIARHVFGQPFSCCPMTSSSATADRIEYQWRFRKRWQTISATCVGEPEPPRPGSEAAFIAEHYWAYAKGRNGGTIEYRVEHPPWRIRAAVDPQVDVDVAESYGPDFAAALSAKPTSAFVAEGSGVRVYSGRRMHDSALSSSLLGRCS